MPPSPDPDPDPDPDPEPLLASRLAELDRLVDRAGRCGWDLDPAALAEIAQVREAVRDVVDGPAPEGADQDAEALLDVYLPPLEELDRERGCAR